MIDLTNHARAKRLLSVIKQHAAKLLPPEGEYVITINTATEAIEATPLGSFEAVWPDHKPGKVIPAKQAGLNQKPWTGAEKAQQAEAARAFGEAADNALEAATAKTAATAPKKARKPRAASNKIAAAKAAAADKE